jgi:hypothetical protein
MISPKFFFDWWDSVITIHGADVALGSKSPDFKLARELWVASVFAVCMRITSNREHWVSPVYDTAPDALVAYFDIDDLGASRQIYPIEVTEFDDHSKDIKQTLKKKLDKAYDPSTRIICYLTRKIDHGKEVDLRGLMKYVNANNPNNYEVWLLGGFQPKSDKAINPQKLFCLTTGTDYQIDLEVERHTKNQAEAVSIPTAKSANRDGKFTPLGKITLAFPVLAPNT